jgi:hypothetical protein
MSSQIGFTSATDRVDDARHTADDEPTPRDRVVGLLHDPKAYFADARQWASRKARTEVQRELSEREAQRERRSPLLRALGFAGR